MRRRAFLEVAGSGLLASVAGSRLGHGQDGGSQQTGEPCHLTYPSPRDAMQSPRETVAYVTAIYVNTATKNKPDYLATIDLDPESKTYAKWCTGSRCRTSATNCTTSAGMRAPLATGHRARRYLIIPGIVSGRIHIVDTADPGRTETASGDRAGRDRPQDQADRAPHGSLPGRRADHDFHARRRETQRPGRIPAPGRQVRDRRSLGARDRGDALQL